jgi:F-type H+-transporting ATPase subunit a
MQVSLATEPIFRFLGGMVSNSLFTSWIVVVFILVLAAVVGQGLRAVPGPLQAAFELVYEGFEGLAQNVLGNPEAVAQVLPFALTLFFYIVVSNLVGLLPGFGSLTITAFGASVPLFRAPTSDLNTTILLAVITVAFVQYLGIKRLGARGYLGKFFTLASPLKFLVGLQEFISELTRVISFSFRLFGNVFAGDVIISVITYLTSSFLPYLPVLPLPFYFLEVGFDIIQAFVFAFLTIVFAGLAITRHDEHEVAVA